MTSEYPPASHLRRMGSLFYDILIVVFVLMIFSGIVIKELFVETGLVAEGSWVSLLFMLVVIYAYFAWTWTHYGQTIGLRAWRIKLITDNGKLISLRQASLRFITALPGWSLLFYGVVAQFEASKGILRWNISHPEYLTLVALLWLMWDSRPGNWRDRLSHTLVVRLV